MIYLLDKNGKEFAVTSSNVGYFLNLKKELICIDENGVFYSPFDDATVREYVKRIQLAEYGYEFEIVGFDYKCRHYELISAGVAKEDIARRLF